MSTGSFPSGEFVIVRFALGVWAWWGLWVMGIEHWTCESLQLGDYIRLYVYTFWVPFSIQVHILARESFFNLDPHHTFKANDLDILQSGIKSETLRSSFVFQCSQLTTIQYRDCEMTVTIKHYYTKCFKLYYSYCSCDVLWLIFGTIFRVRKEKHWHS